MCVVPNDITCVYVFGFFMCYICCCLCGCLSCLQLCCLALSIFFHVFVNYCLCGCCQYFCLGVPWIATCVVCTVPTYSTYIGCIQYIVASPVSCAVATFLTVFVLVKIAIITWQFISKSNISEKKKLNRTRSGVPYL